jgi:glyoxylase-like metal-dependent hydrolase (beta-lactamase superfamily II)
LALALLGAAVKASAVKPPSFTVHGHTASEAGLRVSSYAVVSGDEVLLVDSQMTNNEVDGFVDEVKKLGGTVKTIFVTHAHPDHYLGLERLKAAFPTAVVMAAPDVAAEIAEKGEGTLKFFREVFMKGALKANLSTGIVKPEPLKGKVVKVGKVSLELLTYADAESAHAHALFERSTKTLLAGDLVYNNVHLWLKDVPPKGWLAALKAMAKLKAKKIYPGHGESGGPELLTQTVGYLTAFDAAVKSSKSASELIAAVTAKFPAYQVKPMLEMAAPTYFPAAATPGSTPGTPTAKPAEAAPGASAPTAKPVPPAAAAAKPAAPAARPSSW